MESAIKGVLDSIYIPMGFSPMHTISIVQGHYIIISHLSNENEARIRWYGIEPDMANFNRITQQVNEQLPREMKVVSARVLIYPHYVHPSRRMFLDHLGRSQRWAITTFMRTERTE